MGSDLGDYLEPRHVDNVVAPNLTLFGEGKYLPEEEELNGLHRFRT
jgi:hypothetical protein